MSNAMRTLLRMEELISSLKDLRASLLDSLKYRPHPIFTQIAKAYELEAQIAASRYWELLAALKPKARRNPPSGVALEILERAFAIIARDAIEARAAADRASRSRRRDLAKAFRVVADRMERLAREAARNLLTIASERGADTEWIIRHYRLKDWL